MEFSEGKNCQINNYLSDILTNSRDIIYKYSLLEDKYDFISDFVECFSGVDKAVVLEKGIGGIPENFTPRR